MNGRRFWPGIGSRCALGAWLGLCAAATSHAGGTPENMLLIIDPANSLSRYVGNYYQAARDVPARNVLYMAPGATDYESFAAYNLDGLFGTLANAHIADHIDYILIMPGAPYRISAGGLITDECASVSSFAISSAYTMAFLADEILEGGLLSSELNRYYGAPTEAPAFDSSISWWDGEPSEAPFARRYFIGALLGYTGERGNSLDEILALIDRSVAADGTRPEGTFYFLNNESNPLRNVRAPQYPGAVVSLESRGAAATILDGILPTERHDCLGVMTGASSPPVDSEDMTIRQGAFADHLTSFAAHFDTSSQTKLSRWITRGASGSWGAVEEPCNYIGKFPHARFHAHYFTGSSLGEAALRSAWFVPFQMLLYGDPMTRPFAHLPSVTLDEGPSGPVSGIVSLKPSATTTHATAAIASFDLLIDGVLHESITPGTGFVVDTTTLADGWHDVRILAHDDTVQKSVGRWVGELIVNNHGRSVELSTTQANGNLTTTFEFEIEALGGTPAEVRLIQNDRVIAAEAGTSARVQVYGLTLGAGPARVQAEAVHWVGPPVRSAPLTLDVRDDFKARSGRAPTAFSYTRRVMPAVPAIVELPATSADPEAPPVFELVSWPVQATVPLGQTGPYRLIYPADDAKGLDPFLFKVSSPEGMGDVATVTLDYGVRRGDLNCDGHVDFDDIDPFVAILADVDAWQETYPSCAAENGDVNGDGAINFDDIDPFVAALIG